MSEFVTKINTLFERSDDFSEYKSKWGDTVLDVETYGSIVGILHSVAKAHGLVLDNSKLRVKLNPAGISIKGISLSCPKSSDKKKLIEKVAEITGDDNIKNTFNKNLKVNLYNSINREFADKVREELNLEVTHQSVNPAGSKSPSEILPMATFTQPAVIAKKPESLEIELPDPDPDKGAESTQGQDNGGGMGGGGMGGGGDLDLDLEGELDPGEEFNVGSDDFGIEAPETPETPETSNDNDIDDQNEEEAPNPKPGEEDDMISFESVTRIAKFLTEDPDVFTF